ncbi:hypothetical protein, partial [Vibrio cholerae]|uniref:hypothetical protein n=1 Tax=Vibrio cholerae TaxID=666 RepID=UPI001124E362
ASKLIANGYLLLNTALTGQALWAALPPALQSRLQALSVQVATIDADGLLERNKWHKDADTQRRQRGSEVIT